MVNYMHQVILLPSDDVIENFDTVARELDQYYGKTNTTATNKLLMLPSSTVDTTKLIGQHN